MSATFDNVLRALESLVATGMISEEGALTTDGEKIAECPSDLSIARMVCVSVLLLHVVLPEIIKNVLTVLCLLIVVQL